jgi:hypothetical protein
LGEAREELIKVLDISLVRLEIEGVQSRREGRKDQFEGRSESAARVKFEVKERRAAVDPLENSSIVGRSTLKSQRSQVRKGERWVGNVFR